MESLIKEFKGLPPWGRVAVVGALGAATVLYISNSKKQSAAALYQIAPTPEELPQEPAAQYEYIQGQLQDLVNYVDSNNLGLNDAVNAEIAEINDIFLNTTESIISELNDVKGQLSGRVNAGDMSQETGGTPGLNQNLALYNANDANYGKSDGTGSERLSAADQLARTAGIISDMIKNGLDTTIQDNWFEHVSKYGENYDKVPVSSSSKKSGNGKGSVSITVNAGADGKAPSGLKQGDKVKTNGGTYEITGVDSNGKYTSVKI